MTTSTNAASLTVANKAFTRNTHSFSGKRGLTYPESADINSTYAGFDCFSSQSVVLHLVALDYTRIDWNETTSLLSLLAKSPYFVTLWLANAAWGTVRWGVAFSAFFFLYRRFHLAATSILPPVWIAADRIVTAIGQAVIGFAVPDVAEISLTQTGFSSLLQVADLGGPCGCSRGLLARCVVPVLYRQM